MGRLIDAEIQTDYIVEHDLAFEYAIQHQDRKELERLIAEIPTAYDPDKVVEQMEHIDYTALYEQNEDFKRYVDRYCTKHRVSVDEAPGADGGDAIQGADGYSS